MFIKLLVILVALYSFYAFLARFAPVDEGCLASDDASKDGPASATMDVDHVGVIYEYEENEVDCEIDELREEIACFKLKGYKGCYPGELQEMKERIKWLQRVKKLPFTLRIGDMVVKWSNWPEVRSEILATMPAHFRKESSSLFVSSEFRTVANWFVKLQRTPPEHVLLSHIPLKEQQYLCICFLLRDKVPTFQKLEMYLK
jgi:hypothetical protein